VRTAAEDAQLVTALPARWTADDAFIESEDAEVVESFSPPPGSARSSRAVATIELASAIPPEEGRPESAPSSGRWISTRAEIIGETGRRRWITVTERSRSVRKIVEDWAPDIEHALSEYAAVGVGAISVIAYG
jgi:hypothetical protein